MFVMIHLCVTVRKKNQIIRARERIFTGMFDFIFINTYLSIFCAIMVFFILDNYYLSGPSIWIIRKVCLLVSFNVIITFNAHNIMNLASIFFFVLCMLNKSLVKIYLFLVLNHYFFVARTSIIFFIYFLLIWLFFVLIFLFFC